jgi:SPP1 family predicted phage head-tail adaptor
MQAGPLDRRVTLQAPITSQDSAGQALRAWSTLGDCWAQRIDARGREALAAGAVGAVLETVWRIRWRSDLTEACRLVFEGEAWDIQSIGQLGRRDGLELRCVLVTDRAVP